MSEPTTETPPPVPSTATPPAAAPSPEASKHVTPVNSGHALFGRVFTVIKEDAEYVYTELKDAFHWIEARFSKSEVTTANPPAATATPVQAAAAPSN